MTKRYSGGDAGGQGAQPDRPGVANMTPQPTIPVVRAITIADLKSVLAAGWSDFRRAPSFGLFFGGVYAAGGIALLIAMVFLKSAYLAYPLAIGFPLLGPFIAVGLYEISRRLEQGEPLTWSGVLGVIWQQRKRELSWMTFVVLFVFMIWLYQVRLLLALFLGFRAFSSLDTFMTMLFTTSDGLMFLIVGHIVGAVLALVLFALTVISCPLLLDRNNDFITAMIASVRSVTTSPVPMLGWGIVVTLALILAAIPFFLGLLIVLPVLGHATWHLYRRAIEPLPAEIPVAGGS